MNAEQDSRQGRPEEMCKQTGDPESRRLREEFISELRIAEAYVKKKSSSVMWPRTTATQWIRKKQLLIRHYGCWWLLMVVERKRKDNDNAKGKGRKNRRNNREKKGRKWPSWGMVGKRTTMAETRCFFVFLNLCLVRKKRATGQLIGIFPLFLSLSDSLCLRLALHFWNRDEAEEKTRWDAWRGGRGRAKLRPPSTSCEQQEGVANVINKETELHFMSFSSLQTRKPRKKAKRRRKQFLRVLIKRITLRWESW